MIELFSDIFTNRDNALTETDARIKLIGVLFALVLSILSVSPVFPAVLFFVSVVIVMALRLPWKLVCMRFLLPVVIVCVLGVLQLFMTEGTALFTVPLSPWVLTATREGFLNAVHIGSRVLGGVGMVIVLGVSTPAHDVFGALLWMRAPRAWVEVAMLMYRYIFVLLEITMDMATAQKHRLGYSTTAISLKSAGALAGAVILRAMDQSVKTSEAMLLRGYRGELPVGRPAPFTFRSGVTTAILCTVLLGLFSALNGGTP